MLGNNFEKLFRQTWALLERTEPTQDKIDSYFQILRPYPDALVARTFLYFGKIGRPNDKEFGSFPTGPQFIERLGMIKKSDERNFKAGKFSHQTKKMSDDECDAEYQKMSGFFKAYPYPDSRAGATTRELQRAEDDYHQRMRKAGIEPDEATHPKVGKLLMADLIKTLPTCTSILPYNPKVRE